MAKSKVLLVKDIETKSELHCHEDCPQKDGVQVLWCRLYGKPLGVSISTRDAIRLDECRKGELALNMINTITSS